MATVVSIKVASLTAQRTFANDTKAAEILRLYAVRKGMPLTATNQEALQFAVDQLVNDVVQLGRAQFLEEFERTRADPALGVGLE